MNEAERERKIEGLVRSMSIAQLVDCIRRMEDDDARKDAEIERLRAAMSECDDLRAELDHYKRLATQRAARMQIMLKFMRDAEYGGCGMWRIADDFFEERPEAKEWFDADGVPVEAALRGEEE